MAVEPLSQKEIEERLAELPGWSVDDGRLTRLYRLGSHFGATALVVHIEEWVTTNYTRMTSVARKYDADAA